MEKWVTGKGWLVVVEKILILRVRMLVISPS